MLLRIAYRPSPVCSAAPVDLYDFNTSPEEFTELAIRAADLVPTLDASGSSATKVELLLRSLPGAVNLAKLEIHGLDFCEDGYWGDDERQRLADSLNRSLLPKLNHLSIVNSLGAAEETAALLAPALSALTGLQYLDLSHNNLGAKGADLLSPALKRLTLLKHLDLSHAGMNYGNAFCLSDTDFLGLSALLELRSLKLSGNCLDVNGMSSLVHAVANNPLKYLQHLDLSGNAMGPEGVAWLAAALKNIAPPLQHLDVSNNAMGDVAAATLAPALRSLTRLQHLDLGDNKLGWKGAAALAPAVKSLRSSLTHLNLGGNFGSAEEAEWVAIMAPVIKALSYLQHLDISNTGLGFAVGGAAVLAPSLRAFWNLRHLNLRDNHLGVDGIIALLAAPAIPGLGNLQHLDIGGSNGLEYEAWPGPGDGGDRVAGREGALAWAARLKEGNLKSLKNFNIGNLGFEDGCLTLDY